MKRREAKNTNRCIQLLDVSIRSAQHIRNSVDGHRTCYICDVLQGLQVNSVYCKVCILEKYCHLRSSYCIFVNLNW